MILGLALEGCAGRAAFLAGAVARLEELGVSVSVVAGASAGAIVAAAVADDRALELPGRWLASAGRPVFRPAALLRGRWPLRMSEIVGDALDAMFGRRQLGSLPRPVAIPVTFLGPLGRTRRVLVRGDPVGIAEAVLGSCFVPGPYSRPVRPLGRLALDGAWQVRTPVADARALGADRVLAVVANPAGALMRGFPLSREVPPPAWCRVLAPPAPLALGPYDPDPARIRDAIDLGARAAEGFVRRQSSWLAQSS